jgi:hypothetical protein
MGLNFASFVPFVVIPIPKSTFATFAFFAANFPNPNFFLLCVFCGYGLPFLDGCGP